MARDPLTINATTRAGVAIATTTIGADGVSFPFSEQPYLYLLNDSGDPINLVAETNEVRDGLTLPDQTIAVADAAEKIVRPYTDAIYRQSDGLVYLNGEGLKVMAFK